MANGDDAAEVGMDVVAGSQDIRQVYSEVNKTRDYLAQHRTSGTHRADQITSGTLPVARGGTGRNNLYAAFSDVGAHPTTNRLLMVDQNNIVRSLRNGDLDPAYIGYRLHFGIWEGLTFAADGTEVVAHEAGFTPTFVQTQGFLTAGGTAVIVTPRADNEPANSENVFLRAFNLHTGTPYQGNLSKVSYIVGRSA
ncbi:hypothetical protein [Jiangella gansuensis]|uniref:hypothetical protein n=1 Tax=Jiangella gansuensis TaxID=281473 RepID=UPI00047BB6D0|nr:hypothetical protein [Jiangella gansuensis]